MIHWGGSGGECRRRCSKIVVRENGDISRFRMAKRGRFAPNRSRCVWEGGSEVGMANGRVVVKL